MKESPPHVPFSWTGFTLVMLVAVIMRGGVLWVRYINLDKDPDAYRAIADTLVTHQVFGTKQYRTPNGASAVWEVTPTAYRPLLYPWVLSLFGRSEEFHGIHPLWVARLHFVVGLLTVALTVALAWQLGMGSASLFAGAFVACDPLLLFSSTFVMTETLATFLAVVSLLALRRLSDGVGMVNAAIAGVSMGLAILCRPTFLALSLFAAFAIFFLKTSWRTRIGALAIFICTHCAVLGPWTYRNYRQFNRPVFATTHGGYTLLLGNNRYFYEYIDQGKWGVAWDHREFEQFWQREARGSEVDRDAQAYGLALAAIEASPRAFVVSCFVRMGRLWNPLPYQLTDQNLPRSDSQRYLVAGWYMAIYLIAVVGIVSLGHRAAQTPWLWAILLCLSITAVHTLYWSNMRMRAPLIPVVCLLAAVGIREIARRFRIRGGKDSREN